MNIDDGREEIHKNIRMLVPIDKSVAPKHTRQITYGVIAEPSSTDVLKADLQGDCYKPEDIELMAHGFMERSQAAGEMHKALVPGAKVVESYLAPVDFVVKTIDGDETVLKDSWVLAMRWPDEQWAKIEKGEYTGYSIGGTGLRTPISDAVGDQVSALSKAADASTEPRPLNWLHGVEVGEVSAVDKGANGKKFLILKAIPELREKVEKTTIAGWLISALRKAAGKSGPTTEVDEMTPEEIRKAIADGAAEVLGPIHDRIDKLEAALATADEASGTDDTNPVSKADDQATQEPEPTPQVTAPSAEEIAKMVTAGVTEALKPLAERIEKLENIEGVRQSGQDDAGAHQVAKNAGGFWEGSGLLMG